MIHALSQKIDRNQQISNQQQQKQVFEQKDATAEKQAAQKREEAKQAVEDRQNVESQQVVVEAIKTEEASQVQNAVDRKLVKYRIERDYDSKYVSMINMPIPYSFNGEFFKWFEYREWEKVKGIFKEMKRRRGDGKAIQINLSFAGEPLIRFMVNADKGQWFRTSVEKIDFV